MNRLCNKVNINKNVIAFLGGALMGTIMFIMIYGVAVLNVTYEAFIINEGTDLPGFFIIWDAYRDAGWENGIGLFDTLTYPNTASYALSDCAPLLGLILKVIAPILPETFQYAGLWALICFIMQGGCGAVIIYRYCNNAHLSILLAIPFIIAVPVITKLFYHHAQAGQWVILVALIYWIYKDKERPLYKECVSWALIGLITVGTNIYAIPMVGMIYVGYALNCVLDNKQQILKMICSLFSYLLTCVAFIGVMGGFASNFTADDSFYAEYIDRLERCGSNLNTFINSLGISYLTRPFNIAKDGQGEGLAYLGAGMIIALVVACSVVVARLICRWKFSRGQKEFDFQEELVPVNRNFEISIFVVFVLSVIVSLGPTISINSRILFTIPYPEFILKLWCNFRSTGRLIWPAFYIIFLFIFRMLYSFKEQKKKIIVGVLLVACCVIQVVDLHQYLKSKHDIYANYQELKSPIDDDAWDYLGENYEHMVVLPNSLVNRSDERNVLAKIAVDYNITLNDYYLARQDLSDQSESYKKEFEQGKIAKDTFYVIKWYELAEFIDYDINWYAIDGFIVGTQKNISEDIDREPLPKDVLEIQVDEVFEYRGVEYNDVFNPVYYYYSYSDVEKEVEPDDYESIFNHFITVGMKEGRRACDPFDPQQYREKNGDLQAVYGDDWAAYYKHYEQFGKYEGR